MRFHLADDVRDVLGIAIGAEAPAEPEAPAVAVA
jgi:hypothetical protein